jgi:D-3-phosphoglycerate dehydrogenase
MLGDYDAVIVRSPTKLTRDHIAAGARLKFIGRAGVGVDNIDMAEATSRGIIVMNAPGGNTVSTAEHTVAMILSVARRITQADRSIRRQEWDRKALRGVQLHGKTLGVIGFGRVGREVARRMLAFSMRVLATDPAISKKTAAEWGIELVVLDELLEKSHVITAHVPLDAGTRGIVSDREIDLMSDGVFLVNCARGGVFDEGAVGRGLETGKVAGVALDVYEAEPPGKNPLFSHERSVFTPHLGAATSEAQVSVAVEIAEKIANALTKGEIRDGINRPSG